MDATNSGPGRRCPRSGLRWPASGRPRWDGGSPMPTTRKSWSSRPKTARRTGWSPTSSSCRVARGQGGQEPAPSGPAPGQSGGRGGPSRGPRCPTGLHRPGRRRHLGRHGRSRGERVLRAAAPPARGAGASNPGAALTSWAGAVARGRGAQGRGAGARFRDPRPMALVLLPLPALDFDPTEVAVSWQVLCRLGHQVVFATPEGQPGQADDLMVSGRGLDPWGGVPLAAPPAAGRAGPARQRRRPAGLRRVGAPSFLLGPASLARPRCGRVRRDPAPGWPSGPGHAAVPGERGARGTGGGLLRRRQARGGDLSRRAAGGAQS